MPVQFSRGCPFDCEFVDDNFIGHRKHAKELLQALIEWRRRVVPGMGFLTEASVNLADHPELVSLAVEAGFKTIFVGLETPSVEGLGECGKRQNRNRDLAESVGVLRRAGLEVMGGFIVGFDSDRPDMAIELSILGHHFRTVAGTL